MNVLFASMVIALAQAGAPAAQTDPSASAATGPVVVLETSLGAITIELKKDKAPITVENFVKYVNAKHYDGTIFHRVIPDFMVQGGGMTIGQDSSLTEKTANPPIRNEAKNGLRNLRGSISMARTNAPDSAKAQFFINVKNNAALDYGIGGAGYAVFGEVTSGMDVVDRIVAVRTGNKGAYQNVPIEPVLIKTARVISK
jgi:cyclophilin family peptidyl-prolyl cis-trans isomerase